MAHSSLSVGEKRWGVIAAFGEVNMHLGGYWCILGVVGNLWGVVGRLCSLGCERGVIIAFGEVISVLGKL